MENSKQKNEIEIEIDLAQMIRIIMGKAIIIILVGIMAGVSTLLITKFCISPVYQSSTKLYVINRANDGATTLMDLQSSSQLTKDYKILVTSRPVLEQVIKQLKLEVSYKELSEQITVNTPTDTRVLEIIVDSTDPYRAKEIADLVADISATSICDVMQIEKVNIIEEGNLPTEAISPNPIKNAIIGLLVGMVSTCGFVIVKSLLDDTIKNSDDVEKYLGISTLAMIPLCEEMDDGSKAKGRRAKKLKTQQDKVNRK